MNNKIYIAGKITGLPPMAVKQKFEAAALHLRRQGYQIINPVELVKNPNEEWITAMRICIAALMECSHIYMLKDWRSSKGACTEYSLATSLKFNIIHEK